MYSPQLIRQSSTLAHLDPYVSNFNFKLANSPQPKLSEQRHIHFNKKSFIGNLFSLAMESSSSSSSSSSKYSLSSWEYLALLFIRPILAIAFVISLISLGNYFSPSLFFTIIWFSITSVVFERN